METVRLRQSPKQQAVEALEAALEVVALEVVAQHEILGAAVHHEPITAYRRRVWLWFGDC